MTTHEQNPLGRLPDLSQPTLEGVGISACPEVAGYEILRILGEGGMGVVYLALQKAPIQRQVALKIIKPGMDSKTVLARFETERQALAMMDHPSIARVFDGGTTDTGRPYFVMELVRGIPITEYCDKNKLDTRGRLDLFVQVCNAVQHAHQKGIIHRDIKPSNVLVTLLDGTPVPKVIDFGVAKATNQRLTERTLFTQHAQMIGTPEYMSPEQAEMTEMDVDTRTDVYSLGVLLYELLTGSTPFEASQLRQAGYAEMQRIICEMEAQRPSTKLRSLGATLTDVARLRQTHPEMLSRLIRGDLDWIVMKCLEKDRTRRYETAHGLAEDIERHLRDEPISAGRPSTLHRCRKFVRRNRALVGGAATVLAVLILGIAVSTRLAIGQARARAEAEAARKEAERQTHTAQAVADFLTNDLLGSVAPERAKSPEVTVRSVLDAASNSLQGRFRGEPLVEASIREKLGETYQQLGVYGAAEQHLRQAYKIRQQQLGLEDPATLTSASQLGWVYFLQARYDDANGLLPKVLEGRTRALGPDDPQTLESMNRAGWLLLYRRSDRLPGDQAAEEYARDIERLFSAAFQTGRRMLGDEHPLTLEAMSGLAQLYLGRFYFKVEYAKKAEPLCSKGLAASLRVLGDEHEVTLRFMNQMAQIYSDDKRYDQAEPLLLRSLERSRRVLGEEHPITLECMNALGVVYADQGRYLEAEPLLAKSLEISSRILGPEHLATLLYTTELGSLYAYQGRYEEAEKLLNTAFEGTSRLVGNGHILTYACVFRIYELYVARDRPDRVATWLSSQVERLRKTLGDNHPSLAGPLNDLAWSQAADPLGRLRDGQKAPSSPHETR